MKRILLLPFIGCFILMGCSPFALVNSEVYNNANLNTYKTFKIVTPDDGKLPPGMQMVTYFNIAASIREQMIERGFTESSNSPLLINIALTVKRQIETEPVLPSNYYFNRFYPYYMYPRNLYWQGYYANARLITGIYKEGVLTMEFVNIQEKIPLYSASVSTILQPGESQFRNLTGIAQAVRVLFSDFPVKLLPQYQK